MARPILRLYDGFPNTSPHLQVNVKELQTVLRTYGYNVRVDGYFTPFIETVVKHFQSARNIRPTGVVDQNLWAVLLKIPVAPPPPPKPTTPVSPTPPVVGGMSFSTTLAKENVHMIKQMNEFQKYRAIVNIIASQFKIQVSVIAGIGSRESLWGLALTPQGPTGTGDGGHGRGLMQVDDRWHVKHTSGTDWMIPEKHIPYAVGVLKWSIDTLQKDMGLQGLNALRAGIAAYNAGPGNVKNALLVGEDVDFNTTGQDYSRDVLNKAGWFQLYGIV